jgi:hypothetical protein
MLDVHRIKKTKQIVYPLGKADNNHTLVLFPLGFKSNAGNYGDIRKVRDENIVKDRENG